MTWGSAYGTIPAAVLFGALLVGANQLQRTVQVPSAFVITLDGLIVVFVVASQIWAQRRSVKRVDAKPEVSPSSPEFPQTQGKSGELSGTQGAG